MTRKNKFVLTIETDSASDIVRVLRQHADYLEKYPLDDMPGSFSIESGGLYSEVTAVLNAHLVNID